MSGIMERLRDDGRRAIENAAFGKAIGGMDETAVLNIERSGQLRLKAADIITNLLAAAEKALNFIANTESELGITLDSGDALRAAIAKATQS